MGQEPTPKQTSDDSTFWDVTTMNEEGLTAAHVALCQVETELRNANRRVAANALAYADGVILQVRHFLVSRRVGLSK